MVQLLPFPEINECMKLNRSPAGHLGIPVAIIQICSTKPSCSETSSLLKKRTDYNIQLRE